MKLERTSRTSVMLRLSGRAYSVTAVILIVSVLNLCWVTASANNQGSKGPSVTGAGATATGSQKLRPGLKQGKQVGPIESQAERLLKREREYDALYSAEVDKAGLASIRELHSQLDDDKDGSIEPSETGDFIRADLKASGGDHRQKKFHRKDSEITVNDLWHTWRKGDVHNWTVTQTVDWLVGNVELPQYAEKFKRHGVNGSLLPQVAVNSQFLNKVVGVTNPIHRSKITLKAMDVVLFGPPKDSSNPLKDVIISSLLVLALTLLFYAYRQNKQSKQHMQKMMVDMDGLAKAEKELQELQSKLQQRDSELELLPKGISPESLADQTEVSRLREEVEVLRSELQRAEVELEDKCWMASPVLQHWLQLTYEMESASYNAKRKAAEEQLAQAKDMCDKLNKKRSSFVGAFVSTHGRSIDDVDKSILEAKTALSEVTKDLTERSQRWRQIEMLCGCSIVSNPGIAALNQLVRHVGTGRGLARSHLTASSRMSNRGSQDDLLTFGGALDGGSVVGGGGGVADCDTHSVAASSTHTHMTSASSMAARYNSGVTGSLTASTASVSGAARERALHIASAHVVKAAGSSVSPVGTPGGSNTPLNRDSSDEQLLTEQLKASSSGSPATVLRSSAASVVAAKGPRIGPGGRRMVKSFSQDAATAGPSSTFVKNAAVAMIMASETSGGIHPSASDSHLSASLHSGLHSSSGVMDPSSRNDMSNRSTSPLTKSTSPLAASSSQHSGQGSDASLNAATGNASSNPSVRVQSSEPADQQQQLATASSPADQLSDSASVTSSSTLDLTTGSSDEKAKKKRRSFFNFRRSAKRDSHKKGETVP